MHAEINPVDLAWAAGFFDGEGCVSVYKTRGYGRGFKLRVSLTQREKKHIDTWVALFGNVGRTALLNHERRSPCWQWSVDCRQAATVLEQLLPHLVVKRAQAELGVRFQNRRRPSIAKSDSQYEWDLWAYEESARLKRIPCQAFLDSQTNVPSAPVLTNTSEPFEATLW